jgi:hypothetical protein
MKQASIFLMYVLALMALSCQKEASEQVNGYRVEIWTLKDYTTANAPCELNPARLEEDERIIANDEILSYHASDHYFTLTAAAINRLKSIKSKIPFYLKVNNKVVYTGFLMPAYLSLACGGSVVIDPISYTNNMIWVNFPHLTVSQQANDLRNSDVLLKALEEQGKLRK